VNVADPDHGLHHILYAISRGRDGFASHRFAPADATVAVSAWAFANLLFSGTPHHALLASCGVGKLEADCAGGMQVIPLVEVRSIRLTAMALMTMPKH
jgi:hypothetical protein